MYGMILVWWICAQISTHRLLPTNSPENVPVGLKVTPEIFRQKRKS